LNNSQEKEENDSFLLQISIVNILGRRLVGWYSSHGKEW
jgi:hypothetical protein